MVFFSCEGCNETLKKNQVYSHFSSCKANCWGVTCIDCNSTFEGADYIGHVACISEAEKYEKHLYKGKNINKAKRNPQDEWVNLLNEASKDSQAPTALRPFLARLAEHGQNVPKQEKKFMNFIEKSLNCHNKLLVSSVWKHLESLRKAQKEAKAEEEKDLPEKFFENAPQNESTSNGNNKAKHKSIDDEPSVEKKKRSIESNGNSQHEKIELVSLNEYTPLSNKKKGKKSCDDSLDGKNYPEISTVSESTTGEEGWNNPKNKLHCELSENKVHPKLHDEPPTVEEVSNNEICNIDKVRHKKKKSSSSSVKHNPENIIHSKLLDESAAINEGLNNETGNDEVCHKKKKNSSKCMKTNSESVIHSELLNESAAINEGLNNEIGNDEVRHKKKKKSSSKCVKTNSENIVHSALPDEKKISEEKIDLIPPCRLKKNKYTNEAEIPSPSIAQDSTRSTRKRKRVEGVEISSLDPINFNFSRAAKKLLKGRPKGLLLENLIRKVSKKLAHEFTIDKTKAKSLTKKAFEDGITHVVSETRVHWKKS